MSTRKKEPVVYVIVNVINGKQYVGSTFHFNHRKICHFSDLKTNTHPSKLMQEDYNNYGRSVFATAIIHRMPLSTDENVLIEHEQYFIDTLHPEYNTDLVAGKHIGEYIRTPEAKEKRKQAMLGRKQSTEEKEKRAESIKKFWSTHPAKTISDEQKKHLSEINTGESNPSWGMKRSDDTRKQMSNSMSKIEYKFLSPIGKVCTFRGLAKWCEENNLEYWAMRQLYRGKKAVYNGWRFVSSRKLP